MFKELVSMTHKCALCGLFRRTTLIYHSDGLTNLINPEKLRKSHRKREKNLYIIQTNTFFNVVYVWDTQK